MLEPSEDSAAYRCTQCSHQAVRRFQLDHHIQRNHRSVSATELFHAITKPELYHCVCCDFKSYCKLARYEHCINKHNARNDEDENKKIDQFYEQFHGFPCEYCRYKGHSSISLIKHHDFCNMELKDPIECVTIPTMLLMESNNRRRLGNSRRSKNSKGPQFVQKRPWKLKVPGVIEYFQCAHCPHKSKTKSHLKRHVMVRHATADEVNWFNCTKCSYRSKQKSNLAAHELTHATAEEIDWFNCDQCSYRAKRKGSLTKHMLVHASSDEIQWLTCTECSFRAKRKGHLKSHMLKHATADEIVWFDCVQCSYRAKQKGSLMIHMLRHVTPDDVTWFNCTNCTYRSRYNGNLRKHMLVHASADEIKWFQCTQCSYRAKHKGHLKTHMLRHPTTD